MKKFKQEQIQEIVEDLIKKIPKNDSSASIVLLSGELGAGKTTLTKTLAKKFGVKEEIISPTFVIMKSYEIKDSHFKNFIHIDAYRLEKGRDIEVLGWKNIVSNKENLVVIEWPEMIESHLPKDAFLVKLSHQDDHTRIIEM